MYIKQLLRHPAFQLLLAFLLLSNAITIALRTNSYLGQVGCWPDFYPHWSNLGQDAFLLGLWLCVCVCVCVCVCMCDG